jgi:RNA polymerase sigma-70 factor (ECF subfamily)
MAEAPDDDLFRRMRLGDEAAFAELYRRWQGPLYRFALRMGSQPPLAEDVVHEVFMILIREGGGYDPERGPLAAYLYGAARHQVQRRLARLRSCVALPEDDESPVLAASDVDPLADLTRRERIARVRAAVRSLPPVYREAVVLCDLQALCYEDAARVLECSVGTIRSRLHRARRLLVSKLQAERMTVALDDAGAERGRQ